MKKLVLLFGICLSVFACSKSDDNPPATPLKYDLSVEASEGGSVSSTGGQYDQNASVLVTATPDKGYEFSGWTGTSLSGTSILVKLTSNLTIKANFIRSKYTLTIDMVGSGAVDQQVVNSARGTTEYESGKTIRLTATPQSDFLFYDWQQMINNLGENTFENPFEVEMDQSKTITATFEEKLPLVNPDDTDKNNTVGKWRIRKKRPGDKESSSSGRAVDCKIDEIILRSDNSFALITETSTITGQYTIDSETSISLNQRWIAQRGTTNIGTLSEIELSNNYLSFNIELIGVCDDQLEADRDPTYDEATDPTAPANTKSQTTEIESSTLALSQCVIETELTSNNANQTISLGDAIERITIDITLGSACTETLSVSSSNLPEGVTVSLDNNQITISGTPLSNSVGSFDYDIMLSVASPTIIVSGQIIVEQITTQTNLNQGEGGTSTSTTTSTTSSDTSSAETYTINVTASSSSDYTLSGSDRNGSVSGADPSVTVKVGDTVNFAVNASGHPFYLKTVQETGTDNLISGASGNGATNGTVSWTPTAAGTYYYQCSLHNGMYGTIIVN